jgi:hypothetical protein
MGGTTRFPKGTGSSPKVWNPTPDAESLLNVRAGTWVLVQLNYRSSNLPLPVEMVQGAGDLRTGFFMAHVLVTPNTDEVQQKDGGRIQPTMYGGSATKQATQYHVDPGWTFQVPWDSNISIASGGVSDKSVLVDVVVKVGSTPEQLVEAPVLTQDLLGGLHTEVKVQSQRVYAPPVVGHPEMVPATYQDTGSISSPTGMLRIPFPPGASALQVTDSTAITPAPTKMIVESMGNVFTFGFQPGQIEQLGAMAQGSTGGVDGVPASWGPAEGTTLVKAVVWSKLGC